MRRFCVSRPIFHCYSVVAIIITIIIIAIIIIIIIIIILLDLFFSLRLRGDVAMWFASL